MTLSGVIKEISVNQLNKKWVEEVEIMEFKIGDIYKCPEGHESKIVWINEDRRVIAVKCPQRHFSKMKKVADHSKTMVSGQFP